MPDRTQEHLVDCFARVFPDLSREAIPSAEQQTLAEWDSIAQITLVSLIGEEFGFDVDFEEFENAHSFDAVLNVVRANHTNG